MEYRFLSLEEASIFAGRMESEGYLATVVDAPAATLWGPLAVDGVRVLVSESRGEEECPLPSSGILAQVFSYLGTMFFYAMVLYLGVFFVFWMVQSQQVLLSFLATLAVGITLATIGAVWLSDQMEKLHFRNGRPSSTFRQWLFSCLVVGLAGINFFLFLIF